MAMTNSMSLLPIVALTLMALTVGVRGQSYSELRQDIDALKSTLANLAKQTMSQQLFVEESIRASGSSGIKETRTRLLGNANYFASTHISGGVAAIHDHANYQHAVGMGETVVVLNGVEFRTRHNDYKIVKASSFNRTYGAVEYVDTPEVPPQVLNKPTPEAQMEEMGQFFKAFKEQDITIRDYRPYFKPVLCYIEGAWTLDQDLNDPFDSERHGLVAKTWDELQQQIRYTAYSGTKDLNENFSFLPTTIMGVDRETGQPIYAQWNYDIKCNPIKQEIPTSYFRQQDDLSFRYSTGRTMEDVWKNRAARFRLSEFNEEKFTGSNTLLDNIMKDIPGKDNVPDVLNEAPFGIPVFDTRFGNNNTILNTGYYHRSFKTNKRGAMGLLNIYRGFNDEFLFVAETTQSNIAQESYTYCEKKKKKRGCQERSTGFSYAIPLEVIYLTPLTKWNPYDVPVWRYKEMVVRGNRNGGLSADKAYNGTNERALFYKTPVEFYSSNSPDSDDPADTTRFGVGVLDRNGVVHRMAGSGTRTLTLPIIGAGRVRLRYPIMPVHGEGSSVWKELSVVKQKIKKVEIEAKANRYYIEMQPTAVTGLHKHGFYLTLDMWNRIQSGDVVEVTTSLANGHDHLLEVWRNGNKDRLEYKTCDGLDYCWDQHWRKLIVRESPSS